MQMGWEEDFLNRGKSMDFWLWIHPLNSIFCSKYIVMINKMLLMYFHNKIKILVDGSRNKYRSRHSVWRVNSFSEHAVSLLVCKTLIFLTLHSLGGQSPQPVFLSREQSHFSTHVPYTYCYILYFKYTVMSERRGKHCLRLWEPESCLDGDQRKSACWNLGAQMGLTYLWKETTKLPRSVTCLKLCFWDGRGMETAVRPGPDHEMTGFMIARVTKG